MMPAAEAPIVAVAPADMEALYREAVADRLAGRHREAVTKLDRVLAAQPDNLDARLNLGLAELALGQVDRARRAFAEVLAHAPDYTDARIGLVHAAIRQQDYATARAELAKLEGDARASEDVPKLRGMLAPLQRRWHLDLDGAQSKLTPDMPDWSEQRLTLTRKITPVWTAGVTVERTTRFHLHDNFIKLQVDRRFKGGRGYVTIGATPHADYRPKTYLGAGGEIGLVRHLSLTFDGSISDFPTGPVHVIKPGAALTLFKDRLRLSAQWLHGWDEEGIHSAGYILRASLEAGHGWRLSAGYADAPESFLGIIYPIESVNFGLNKRLNDRLEIRGNYLFEDRGSSKRREYSLGFGWSF